MKHAQPDYERVLALLRAHPGTYYPTYVIAEAVESQANSVQRAINHNLREHVEAKRIVSRKVEGTQVHEYTWKGGEHEGGKEQAHQESVNLCGGCHDSYWYRGRVCVKCGAQTGRGYAC